MSSWETTLEVPQLVDLESVVDLAVLSARFDEQPGYQLIRSSALPHRLSLRFQTPRADEKAVGARATELVMGSLRSGCDLRDFGPYRFSTHAVVADPSATVPAQARQRPRSPSTKALLALLALPGIVFAVVGIPALLLWGYVETAASTARTEGVVVGTREPAYRGARGCTIEFTAPDGQAVRLTDRCNEGARVGDRVPVYYDPDEPTTSRLVGEARAALAFLVGLGVYVLCLGLVARRWWSTRSRRVSPGWR